MAGLLILTIIGFLLLIKGADWLIEGSSALAKRYQVSDLAIGLTIVAFGTSAPELVVNIIASVSNHNDLVFGNIIGSNNFNLFIILGIAGLIAPITVQSRTVWMEIPFSGLAALILLILVNHAGLGAANSYSRADALLLLLLFTAFLFYVYRQMKSDVTDSALDIEVRSALRIWLMILGGLGGLILGGKFVVDSAVKIAETLAISEKIIALTIVAGGTSLPELTTSVIAALKRKNDIAIGNVIGSNIFNILLIISVSGLIRPMAYNQAFNRDLLFLFAGTVFLFLAMFTGGRKRLDRWESALFLLAYGAYALFFM